MVKLPRVPPNRLGDAPRRCLLFVNAHTDVAAPDKLLRLSGHEKGGRGRDLAFNFHGRPVIC